MVFGTIKYDRGTIGTVRGTVGPNVGIDRRFRGMHCLESQGREEIRKVPQMTLVIKMTRFNVPKIRYIEPKNRFIEPKESFNESRKRGDIWRKD